MTSCQCSCKTCADNEFRCGNTRCIPKASRCDGVIDCDTDEVGCGKILNLITFYCVVLFEIVYF